MGNYAGNLLSETLLFHQMKNKSPEYAELQGKRLVTVLELDEDKFLDTSVMKKLCSTDDILTEKNIRILFLLLLLMRSYCVRIIFHGSVFLMEEHGEG